jgi:hypothetical protein
MNGDRPSGESKGKYILGFFMNIGGAALHGFLMPALEYTFLKAGKAMTFDLVLQDQFIVSMFATLFCSISMILNKDFQVCFWKFRQGYEGLLNKYISPINFFQFIDEGHD